MISSLDCEMTRKKWTCLASVATACRRNRPENLAPDSQLETSLSRRQESCPVQHSILCILAACHEANQADAGNGCTPLTQRLYWRGERFMATIATRNLFSARAKSQPDVASGFWSRWTRKAWSSASNEHECHVNVSGHQNLPIERLN